MRKNFSWSWLAVASIALVSAAVLGSGFVMAVAGPQGETTANLPVVNKEPEAQPVAATTEQQEKGYTIVALGDSLTKGVGDPDSKGYVGYLKERLEQDGQSVKVQNLGISGLESGELVKSVQNPGFHQMFKEASLIVLSIGGNDITHSFGGVDKVLGSKGIDEKQVLATQQAYTKNVQTILQTVRTHNPQAPIYVLGLYNPFEGLFEDKDQADRMLITWNENLRATAQVFPMVKVVPMFDIFQWNTNQLLAMDHFHPNQQGYKLMADRIFQTLPKKK